jgi:hypothetical protein
MSSNTVPAVNPLDAAIELINSQKGAEISDLEAYLAKLGEVQEACKALRGDYAKELANLASKRSRAKKAERVAKALALLAEQEAAEAASAQ